MNKNRNQRGGFTLVELLVVISVIAILIGLLLPSVTKARAKSNQVACMSNMRQVGMQMLIYADQWNGYLFPDKMGWETNPVDANGNALPPYQDPLQPQYQPLVWPSALFGVWNPPIMICPTDELPGAQHSYILNEHMAIFNVKYGTGLPGGVSPSNVVLMGEKLTTVNDYYMEYGEFDQKVEEYRHGVVLGSNYLMLDLHVDTEIYNFLAASSQQETTAAGMALDPWDFEYGKTPPSTPTTPPPG